MRERAQRVSDAVLIGLALGAAAFLCLPSQTYQIDAVNILTGPVRLWRGDSPYGALFFYPYWFALALLPLAWVPDTLRETAWFVLCLLTTFGGALAAGLAVGLPWRRIPTVLALVVLYLPAAWNVNVGQTAGFLIAALAMYLYLHHNDRQAWAGAALALLSVKPQLGVCIVVPLLFWHLARREWRVPAGTVAGFAALMALSFALDPAWVEEWRTALGGYYFATATDALGLAPLIGNLEGATVAGAAVLAGLCLWLWGHRAAQLPAVLPAVIIAALVVAPVSHPYDMALMAIPVVLLLREPRTTLANGLLAALYLWPWVWKIAGLSGAALFWPSLAVLGALTAVAKETRVRITLPSAERASVR